MTKLKKLSERKRKSFELAPNMLRKECQLDFLAFDSTADLPPLEDGIIGQERAVRAIEFGLTINHPGYNIYISGPAGTGKNTYAQAKVKKVAESQPTPGDWCYVYNFKQPDQPVALHLPAGQGSVFRKDMEELVEDLKVEIRKAFESEQYEARRAELIRAAEEEVNNMVSEMEERARKEGFTVQRSSGGIYTIPLGPDGKPFTQEEFSQLSNEEKEAISERGRNLQAELTDIMRRVRTHEKATKEKLKNLEKTTGRMMVEQLTSLLKEKYAEHPKVINYLEQVEDDVLENLDDFRVEGGDEELPFPWMAQYRQLQREKSFLKYRVNLFVDNSNTKGAPVIIETNPTYYNLFGKIEHRGDFGTLVTDFTMIKPGAVHLAHGGYLIIQAYDLLTSYLSWTALKRALKSGQARIENMGEHLGLIATTTLKPEPLPLKVKIILVGNPLIYHLLYTYDEDFRKFFKTKVDFDIEMDRTEEHLKKYASFISFFCQREHLLPLDKSAVAKIIEYSSRLAENQEKLSTRFNEVTEVLYEASIWAAQSGHSAVTGEDVETALREKIYRSNRIEEKIRELIANGTIMVSTDGQEVGQVNGLAVLNLGDYTFGKPSRITARTFLGQKGVVNIERETRMSGKIHSKGVLILSGYLGGKYAQDSPLSFSASLTFEQLYEEVEGDSASSTELYALLSDLSGLPISQELAVTGSVNQKGEIQPIGGVNEKIEGFYHVCKVKGFTGRQGVIIPHQNVKNLMLKEEVIESVKKGEFHIYAIKTIDEGIALLTGVEAGELQKDGHYPEGTVNWLVKKRLEELAQMLTRYGRQQEGQQASRNDNQAP